MKGILSVIAFLLIAACVLAQPGPQAKKIFDAAIGSFNAGDAKRAEELAEKAIEINPNYLEPRLLKADLQTRRQDTTGAIKTLTQAIETLPLAFEPVLNLANIHYRTGNWAEAGALYRKLQNLASTPEQFQKLSAERQTRISTIQKLMANPVPYKPENIGEGVNTLLDEYMSAFTADGMEMYFTRRKPRPGVAYQSMGNEDLMVSKRVGEGWSTATDLPGEVNTLENEGAISISPDGTFLVFTACNRPDGVGSCDLYISFWMNGAWTRPANVGAPVNTRFKETQPAISFDGRSIIFSSNREGSIGGLDLWMTTRDDQWNFSEPVNLGPKINTVQDEQTPYLHVDDQTLYFCSRGWPGMGENDIFISRKSADGYWDSARNVGYPINTTQDEPGLTVDREGKYAYITTGVRGRNNGGLDIFRFELPESIRPKPAIFLKGIVKDAETRKPLSSTVELIDLETGTLVNRLTTSSDGAFLMALPGGKEYALSAGKTGYLFYSDNLNLQGVNSNEPYEHDIFLQPLKGGQTIVLRNVFFETNSAKLKVTSKVELQKVAALLKANPTVNLEISGHTDNTGSAERNTTLSRDRARSVHDYLTAEGEITKDRLTTAGYAATKPVADNTTEAGRAQNRRTEIKVME